MGEMGEMGGPGVARGLAATPCGELIAALAARTPVPGGGAAAALAAALGCATGAMAARYTTGSKWGERSVVALSIATGLDETSRTLLNLADEDAAAFAAVGASKAAGDSAALAAAQARSAQIPAEVLLICVVQAQLLESFRSLCNPHLISDVEVGISLLHGAGRAAVATIAANPVSPAEYQLALSQLRILEAITAQPPSGPQP
jgi:formiminotetrahydrofolate cyclodeaminase